MFLKRNNLKLAIVLLFFLSLVLRVYKLGENPTFISDEASIGYNAWSILKTAKDEWGKPLPLYFKAFGEYKLPVYIYLTVPFLAIFGLNEMAVRLASCLAGSLTPILLFLLIRKLTFGGKKSWFIALLSAFLLAINPWHIQISRMAIEANLALFMTCLGIYLLLVGSKKKSLFYLSFIIFGATFFTYNANRVFLPLFLGILAIISRGQRRLFQKNWLAMVIFGICLLLVVATGFRGSKERIIKVSIFSDQGIVSRIIERRLFCEKRLPALVCRLAFNRVVFYPLVFSQNYLSHFSPRFLLQGAGLAQYGMPGTGVIYPIELPFLIIGLWQLLKKKNLKIFILPWLLIAPIANSITGLAHPVRSLLLLPVFPILISLGIYFCFSILKLFRKKYLFSLIFIYLILLGIFLNNYWFNYPKETGSIWQSGYKPLFKYLRQEEGKYQSIWLTKFYGEPHIFYLFYSRFNPASYQKGEEVTRYVRDDGWVNVDQIGKYSFFDKPGDVRFKYSQEIAFYSPTEICSEIEDRIFYQNSQPAFLIFRSNSICPCSQK